MRPVFFLQMKFLSAIIKPGFVNTIREALVEIGIPGSSITEVMSYEQELRHDELYRGNEYVVDLLPRIKIELALVDEQLETACSVFTRVAAACNIFICDLDQAVLIRTGETGMNAI